MPQTSQFNFTNPGKETGKVMLNLLRNEAQMNNQEPAEASMMLNPAANGVSFTLHNLPAGPTACR